MPATEVGEVVGGGAAAERGVDGVVEVAPHGGNTAPGEPAVQVSSRESPSHALRGPVPIHLEHFTPLVVDLQNVPVIGDRREPASALRIDRPESGEDGSVRRGIAGHGHARVGGGDSPVELRHRYRDLHFGLKRRVGARFQLTRVPTRDDLDEGVGASLIDGSGILRERLPCFMSGELRHAQFTRALRQAGVNRLCVTSREDRLQESHTVGERSHGDTATLVGFGVPLVDRSVSEALGELRDVRPDAVDRFRLRIPERFLLISLSTLPLGHDPTGFADGHCPRPIDSTIHERFVHSGEIAHQTDGLRHSPLDGAIAQLYRGREFGIGRAMRYLVFVSARHLRSLGVCETTCPLEKPRFLRIKPVSGRTNRLEPFDDLRQRSPSCRIGERQLRIPSLGCATGRRGLLVRVATGPPASPARHADRTNLAVAGRPVMRMGRLLHASIIPQFEYTFDSFREVPQMAKSCVTKAPSGSYVAPHSFPKSEYNHTISNVCQYQDSCPTTRHRAGTKCPVEVRIDNHNARVDAQNKQALSALAVVVVMLGIAAYILFFRERATGIGVPAIDQLFL